MLHTEDMYSFTPLDVMKILRVSHGTANRYLKLLLAAGVIDVSHGRHGTPLHFKQLRKTNEDQNPTNPV